MNRFIALQKIVETGSFTKAAQSLGYTQPAISQMIASLEEEFSIQLLYRTRAGIQLTLEGEKLFPFIQNTILHQQLLEEAVEEIKGLKTGVIRIGTISSVSSQWLPSLIKQFQQHYPNVEFILYQADYTTIPELINKGEIDFGFINPDAVPHQDTIFLKEGELKAVLPCNHLLATLPSVTLEELSKEPFLLLEEGSLSEPLETFKKKDLQPDIRLRVHDDYSILAMIEEGLGVSILPELVLKRTNYQVTILPITPTITRKIGILSKEKQMIPLASKYFIQFILDHIDLLS